MLCSSSGLGDAKSALINVASAMEPSDSLNSVDEARGGGESKDNLLALGRDGPEAAAEAALPRGIRIPVPAPDTGEVGARAGKDMEAERRFE